MRPTAAEQEALVRGEWLKRELDLPNLLLCLDGEKPPKKAP